MYNAQRTTPVVPSCGTRAAAEHEPPARKHPAQRHRGTKEPRCGARKTAEREGAAAPAANLKREIEMGIPPELESAGLFHTHVGPYLVVGLRMGRAVTDRLGSEPFSYRITARTGRTPPYSCLVDGLQMATPCTTGNGCLEVADDRAMSVEAVSGDGRTLIVGLNADVFERIETECTEENQESFALEIWAMPEGDLLTVNEEA